MVVSLIPEFKISIPTTVGATYRGDQLGNSLLRLAATLSSVRGAISKSAAMTQTLAGYTRRQDD